VNMPGLFWQPLVMASLCGLLGRRAEAAAAVKELLALDKDIERNARHYIECWHYSSGLMDRILEGLQKAGLRVATVSSGEPESAGKSIAVLPFANLSSSPDDEYFSDGITEEITNALARVPGMKVAARTSAFSFKGKNVPAGEIGRSLNVGTILEGSLRRAGKKLRITAQLVNVADGCHLWSERYDRELDDIFAVQDEIATAIARKFEVSAGGPSGPLVKPATRNMEAYELYLKGLHARQHFGTNLTGALDFFERAAARDPEFAPAHASLAQTYSTLALTAALRPSDGMPKAKAAAMRALELDGSLAEAHCALAVVSMLYDWDWEAAEKGLLRALELSPNDSQASFYYGHFYLAYVAGQPEKGAELCRRAWEGDPLAGYALHGLASDLVILERNRELIELCRRELARDPSAFHLQRLLGLGLLGESRLDEAQAAMEEAVRTSGRHAWALFELGMLHARCGHRAEAEAIQEELVSRSRVAYLQSGILAAIPAWLGRFDEALALLERAIEERDCTLLAIPVWPTWSALWNLPRCPELLKRIGITKPAPSGAESRLKQG
ncbi:MAG TPA: hypothetical protein VLE48_07430, partial [Terriglobales bacterium]|nr:hypothetical protein [Terriglobales bacterium]